LRKNVYENGIEIIIEKKHDLSDDSNEDELNYSYDFS